jgi:predicted SAM-dependent methyltransferase
LRIERSVVLGPVIRKTVGLLFPPNAQSGDIVRGLPVSGGSATAVYCSHVLEHLPRDDLPMALGNTFRMLRPGGVFRLVVPDLRWRVARYLASSEQDDPSAADELISACVLGRRTKSRNLVGLAKDHWGNSTHLWMYDFAALKGHLVDAGFVDIRQCELGDASDPMFDVVEDKGRFFEGGERELAIEALKPATPNI